MALQSRFIAVTFWDGVLSSEFFSFIMKTKTELKSLFPTSAVPPRNFLKTVFKQDLELLKTQYKSRYSLCDMLPLKYTVEIKNHDYGKGSMFMPQKSSISPEIEIAAVENYLRGKMGITKIVQELGVSESTLLRWVILYKTHGSEGLVPRAINRRYSPDLKHKVVGEYLSGTSSIKGLCLKHSISDEHVVHRLIKRYNSHGNFKQPNIGAPVLLRPKW